MVFEAADPILWSCIHMDDRVQRFLSKQDWASLLQPQSVKPKSQLKTRASLRKVHFEEDDQQSSLQSRLQLEEAEAKEKAERTLRRERYQTMQQRLQALSQPKKIDSELEEEWLVGPANYDTRLDLSRPCFVSTRPSCPTPVIRQPIGAKGKGSPNRLDTTTTSEEITVKQQERSASVSRLGKKSKEEPTRRKGSMGRDSERRVLELFGLTHFPDLRNYTPTPVQSQKGKYSIPKSHKKFSIKKSNTHPVSQLSQHFNTLFL